uniref:PP2C family protein-serine/threonine phosphatase n=1 Tax=Lachnoclostridium phocaeense TaxID=1871021 RepID=UPI0026DBC6EF|nr:PP2C family serine/threonine-protein phosphatase [Lachnoclostridium phocaeense]
MINKYTCGAMADIGVGRENQEDFVQFLELDEQNLFCVIADGSGSKKEHTQPAPIVVMDIIETVGAIFRQRKELFVQDPEFFIKTAMQNANKLLGAFKLGNEELYAGYAASVTCCFFAENGRIYVGHSGNTRLYIIRDGLIKQLTRDHTKAAVLLAEGKIDPVTYHVHPDRLKLTSGIGVILNPEIQTFTGKMKEQDLILMTTDGIHYALQPEAIMEIVLHASNVTSAAQDLVNAAKNIIKYPDNMSAMLVHYTK